MLKKDLGLLVLILVVGAVVAIINPRFLSPINLANTANLIGLFGMFCDRRRPSSSSPAASSCRSARCSRCSASIFVDLHGRPRQRALVAGRRSWSSWAASCWARSTAS